MPRPVCANCSVEFFPKKNDIVAEEMTAEFGSYKMWCADLWECPGCGAQVVVGFGREAFAEHFEPNYEKRRGHEEKRTQIVSYFQDVKKRDKWLAKTIRRI